MEKSHMMVRGEMSLEQPSADALEVVLSGQWQLVGELPGADKVQQTLQDRPGVRNLVFDETGEQAMTTHAWRLTGGLSAALDPQVLIEEDYRVLLRPLIDPGFWRLF
jgi:hypothetical protein